MSVRSEASWSQDGFLFAPFQEVSSFLLKYWVSNFFPHESLRFYWLNSDPLISVAVVFLEMIAQLMIWNFPTSSIDLFNT